SGGQFQRQARIAARTIRALVTHRDLLNPFKFGFLSFQLVSTKVLRVLSPVFLCGLLATNALLSATDDLYLALFAIQGVVYGVVWLQYQSCRYSGLSRE